MNAPIKLFLSLFSLAPLVRSHLYMAHPPSRQFWQTAAYQSTPTEYCPHCFNFGGVSAVQKRGGGGPWPHLALYREGNLNANGNYMETEETEARHGTPCGDPGQTAPEGSTTYGMDNSNYPVLTELVRGSEFQVKIVVSTYHGGHIELNLCDASGMENTPVTHECLSKYPLTRAPAEMEPPIDPQHPGRYFLDPPCRARETDQSFDTGGAQPGDIVTMTFTLPKTLTCERCVLQMMYYVSNACVHPGYDTLQSDEWPAGCAPTKDDWISKGMAVCGTEGTNYVEEFASCSDIMIVSRGDGGGDEAAEEVEEDHEEETEEMEYDTSTGPDYCDCDCESSCVDTWKQCGGDVNRSGHQQCCGGATCVQYNAGYAQCVP